MELELSYNIPITSLRMKDLQFQLLNCKFRFSMK